MKYSNKLNKMKLELERLDEKIGDGKVLPVNYRKLFDRRKVLVEKLEVRGRREEFCEGGIPSASLDGYEPGILFSEDLY